MRIFFLSTLIFLFLFSSAQSQDFYSPDTLFDSGIFVGASLYSFAYNTGFENGSAAGGVSWFFNDKRINLQIAVMVDFKKYHEWTRGHFYSYQEQRTDVFFPILLHYNFLRLRRTTCFFSLGIVPGKNFYIDENNYTQRLYGIPVYGGIGVSQYILEKLFGRISLNTLYAAKKISPGLSLDLVITLKPKRSRKNSRPSSHR